MQFSGKAQGLGQEQNNRESWVINNLLGFSSQSFSVVIFNQLVLKTVLLGEGFSEAESFLY